MTAVLVEGLVAKAVAALATRGFDRLRDSDQEKALRGIFEIALEESVGKVSATDDAVVTEHVASVFADFLSDPAVISAFLDSTLDTASEHDLISASDRDQLRQMFEGRGFDLDTLPISFDDLVDVFAESLWSGIRAETLTPSSVLFNARAIHLMERLLIGQEGSAKENDRAKEKLDSIEENLSRLVATEEVGPSRVRRERQLAAVPPNVRSDLANRLDEPWAERLLQNLSNSDRSPAATLAHLLNLQLDWMDDAGPVAFLVVGEFAAAHGDAAGAANAWQRAVRMRTADAGLWLCRAALATAETDKGAALALVEEAVDDLDADVQFARLVRAVIAIDAQEMLASADAVEIPVVWAQTVVIAVRAEAMVIADRLDEAISVLEAGILQSPDSAGLMIRLSGLIGARAVNEASSEREQDLRRAEELAVKARDMRRGWRGPSAPAVVAAAQAALVRGDVERAVALTTAGSGGEASSSEARTDEVKAEAILARLGAGDTDRAASIAESIEESVLRREFEAVVADARGDDVSAVEGYLAALESTESLEQRVRIQASLAFLRVEPVPEIDDTRGDAGDEVADRILAIAASANGRKTSAIRLLRRWSSSHPLSAALLADIYARAGDIDEAVAAYRSIHERFGDPRSLVRSAFLLYSAGRVGEARDEALLAYGFLKPDTDEWYQLASLLADIAWENRAWPLAEKYVRSLIHNGDRSANTTWGLLALLFNQRKLERAWADYAELGAPLPRTSDEIRLWADLAGRFEPSDETIARLVQYAEDGEDDEELASAMLAASYLLGSQVSMDAETIRRRQAATDAFVARFPTSRYFFGLQWTDNEELSELLQSHLEPGAREFADHVKQVFRGHMPLGILSTLSGRTYTEALVLRAGLVVSLETADGSLRDAERVDAAAALNGPIAVDPSVLHTASFIRNQWEEVVAGFSDLRISEVSVLDIYSGADVFAARSTGSIGWDPSTQSITVHETDISVADAHAERSQWIADQTRDRLAVSTMPSLERFPDLAIDRFGAWLGAIDIAVRDDIAVMIDDVALRRLARQMGIPAFGSTAVLDVLAGRGLMEGEARDDAFSALRATYAVDLDFDGEAIRALAEAERWIPGAASAVFTRTAAWRGNEAEAVAALVAILQNVSETDPQLIAHWLASAVLGAASGLRFDRAQEIAGRLLAGAIYDFTRERPELIPGMLYATRSACTEIGVPLAMDPISVAVPVLYDVFSERHGPAAGEVYLRKLLTALLPFDQYKALRALDLKRS